MKFSPSIDLEFNRGNLIKLLNEGLNSPESIYSHRQITDWCLRFWEQFVDVDSPEEIEALIPLLADIETQWDLYLSNTFSFEQLKDLDANQVVLPSDWFKNWLEQINSQ